MSHNNLLKKQQKKIIANYKKLMEQAYNLRQTDHALSDDSEYQAIKLLAELNKLKFLSRDFTQPNSPNN